MSETQQASEVVMLSGEQVVTDSRKVAEAFGKQHRNVLQAYRRMTCSENFRLLNFQQTVELRDNPSGGGPIPTPIVQMTKDGFMFLVMGFGGQRAAEVKEAFISAFNEMAEFIRTQAYGAWRQYEEAQLEYRHEQDHASRCGSDLAAWKNRKLVHIARLERLDPQIKLPLYIEKAA